MKIIYVNFDGFLEIMLSDLSDVIEKIGSKDRFKCGINSELLSLLKLISSKNLQLRQFY